MSTTNKYSDVLADWLVELGYTTCFFLAGGQAMHIVESCSRKLRAIPVVHEVAAAIAAEYFNVVANGEKALALVTAGPGLTNTVTGVAGAWLESRELLVVGGQVKTADLRDDSIRQRGIQEVNGVDLMKSITVKSVQLRKPVSFEEFASTVQVGAHGHKGPVFIEIPLDVQGAQVDPVALRKAPKPLPALPQPTQKQLDAIVGKLRAAKRPLLMLGAGLDYAVMKELQPKLEGMGIPIMTTWNGADRIGSDHPLYFGRSDTWGQRYSNLILQQADVLVALGARLGMQQTGFNWKNYLPKGEVILVNINENEHKKGHPRVDMSVIADTNPVLKHLTQTKLGDYREWVDHCRSIKAALPLDDPKNQTAEGYISPYQLYLKVSQLCTPNDLIVPCSSGGAFTVSIQSFEQKFGQRVLGNKALASMGYGLGGAIGAAVAGKNRRTVLFEGDGGFSQNMQEIGTVALNKLNLKTFIFDDNGYASIRMTQSNYFGGRYVGCDIKTGLGLPDWEKLFAVWDVPALRLKPGFENDAEFLRLFNGDGPVGFIVPIDPKQTYFPKITSRVTESGSMESNPLHRMSPDLDDALYQKLAKYLV
jgi:acetolactate synthase-1/2/3 large subunit